MCMHGQCSQSHITSIVSSTGMIIVPNEEILRSRRHCRSYDQFVTRSKPRRVFEILLCKCFFVSVVVIDLGSSCSSSLLEQEDGCFGAGGGSLNKASFPMLFVGGESSSDTSRLVIGLAHEKYTMLVGVGSAVWLFLVGLCTVRSPI